MMAQSLKSLMLKIGVNDKEFRDGIKAYSRELKTLGQAASDLGNILTKTVTGPILAMGAGLTALAVSAGNYADSIGDMASATGMSTQAIQEWRGAATVMGEDADSMSAALEGFIRRFPQLEQESGKATKALEAMGLSYAELRGMNSDEMIGAIINTLAEMDNQLQRTAYGTQIFGQEWTQMAGLLDGGAEGIKAAMEEARQLGLVLDDSLMEKANAGRTAWTKLTAAIQMMGIELGAQLAPALGDLAQSFTDNILPILRDAADFIGLLVQLFTSLPGPIQGVIVGFTAMLAAVGPLLMIYGNLSTGVGKVMADLVKLQQYLPQLQTAIAGFGTFIQSTITFIVTNPIGMFMAAIAGGIAIGWALYNNWDKVTAAAAAAWRWLANQVIGAVNAIIDAINLIPGVDFKSLSYLKAPNDVPAMAAGGSVLTGGTALVGEAGPELVTLPRGAQVQPLNSGGSEPADSGGLWLAILDDRMKRQLWRALGSARASEAARGNG